MRKLNLAAYQHTTKRDKMTIRANYELIIDNLLDLSHTSYLHEGILGNADTVESDITVELEGDDVVVSRFAGNATAPGLFATQWPTAPARVVHVSDELLTAPSMRVRSTLSRGSDHDSVTLSLSRISTAEVVRSSRSRTFDNDSTTRGLKAL